MFPFIVIILFVDTFAWTVTMAIKWPYFLCECCLCPRYIGYLRNSLKTIYHHAGIYARFLIAVVPNTMRGWDIVKGYHL